MLKQLFNFFKQWFLNLFKQKESLFPLPIKTEEIKPIQIFKKREYAINPRSDEAFTPFASMSPAEWKLHPFHRLGSSYLARLRISQGWQQNDMIGVVK
jgi:hypothetical protein